MERALRYKPVVMIELGGQILGQGLGITLAFNGFGVWGPILGLAARSLFQGVAPWFVLRVAPRPSWNTPNFFRMMKFGMGYVASTSIRQGRDLLLLIAVGRVAGQDAVGQMGLALRAAGLVNPFRSAVARVILPALAPIAGKPDALRKFVNEAVETELLLSIPLVVTAVALYQPALRLLLGPAWQATAILFPWIAAEAILASAHATTLSALHVRGFWAESIASALVGDVALVAAVLILGGIWGAEGCAAATLAVWPAAWLHEGFAKRRLGTRWSRIGVGWAIGGAAACLAWRIGSWLAVIPVLVGLGSYRLIQARGGAILGVILRRAAKETGS
jgi:O-antigen/teichoic acid export membrane protein